MKIFLVVGARPNFVKISPIVKILQTIQRVETTLVHTGQHYDKEMSDDFFRDLGIPRPDIYLGVGSGTQGEQTAKILLAFEKILLKENPDIVIVVGDVNSTIACALAAVKLGIKVAHVEAGLRSFDRSMPEEINRVLTDTISEFLFITEESAKENLIREGIPEEKIHYVGNVMIDTLIKQKKAAEKSDILFRLNLVSSSDSKNIVEYASLTLHRPSNVDDRDTFVEILDAVHEISKSIPIFLPAHPRTLNQIRKFNLDKYFYWNTYFHMTSKNLKKPSNQICPFKSINIIPPLGYLDFLQLISNSRLVLTDSGGIQEETTVLRIPCVTIRDNTERPVTVTHGTNRVVGTKKEKIIKGCLDALNKKYSKISAPPLWDGKAAERIIDIIIESANKGKKRGQGRKGISP